MNERSNVFGRIGRWSAAHPWITILCCVVVAAGILTAANATTALRPDEDFTEDVETQVATRTEVALCAPMLGCLGSILS